MLQKVFGLVVATSIAAAPFAALAQEPSLGERRSGAAAGAYFSIPFGGSASGTPQAGLRLQMVHDYRSQSTRDYRTAQANALDLRLSRGKQPTLYVANMPVTGDEGRKHNLTGAGTLVTVVVLAAAAVGTVVILNALLDDDDDDLDERRCLLPEGCP